MFKHLPLPVTAVSLVSMRNVLGLGAAKTEATMRNSATKT